MKYFAIMIASALMVLSACKKEDSIVETTTPIPTYTGYTASYTLDGRTISIQDGINGFITPSGWLASSVKYDTFYIKNSATDSFATRDTTQIIRASYALTLAAKGSTERIVINTDTLFFTDSNFYSNTRPGSHSFNSFFSRSAISLETGGARISFYASDSTVWTSAGGAQAAGTSINLGTSAVGALSNGQEYVKSSLSFGNVVLYKINSTETKTLSSGNVNGYFINGK